MRTNLFRRAVVAGASVAVAAAGLTAVTATSASAESASLKYTCGVSVLTGQKFAVVVDTDLPDSVKQGTTTPVKFKATVLVPESPAPAAPGIVETLRNLEVANVEGTATVKSSLNDVAQADANLAIPKTAVPASGPVTIVAEGFAPAFVASKLGTNTVKAAAFSGTLTLTKADGTPPIFGSPAALTCEPDAGQDLTVDTVEVTKAATPAVVATKTTAKASYAKKAKKATVNVKVVNNKKQAVQGKVKLVLKKGKKVVGRKTVTLSKKGVAKGAFTKVKAKGKYTVTAEFQGNKTAKKSKATAKFTVK